MRQQSKLYNSQREKRKRERDFAAKISNLRHSLACSQNKGLSEYQRRASQVWTAHLPARGREAGSDSQSQKARGSLGPRDGILH